MIHQEHAILLLLVTAAAVLPLLSRVFRLPGPVTEIVFGIVIGQSVLGLEMPGEWLPFLADLGFLLLMFQAGMEIDFAMLRAQSAGQLGFHFLVFFATLGLAFAFALLIGKGVFMALVLSTTSLGLVMPLLREIGLSKAPLGQNILIASTLADFLTLLGITLFLLWSEYGLSIRFFYPIPLFVGFTLLLRLVRLWAWWNPGQVERILGPEDNREVGTRLSLMLLLFFVIFAELVHLEPVLRGPSWAVASCLSSFASGVCWKTNYRLWASGS